MKTAISNANSPELSGLYAKLLGNIAAGNEFRSAFDYGEIEAAACPL